MKKERILFLNNITQFEILKKEGLVELVKQCNSYSKFLKSYCLELIQKVDQFDRIYFGNEFCEYLNPTLDDLKMVIQYFQEKQIPVSFVTPYISEGRLENMDKKLDYLNKLDLDFEIVCNDWGICYRIYEKYPSLTIVLGRMLDKMSKDARLSKIEYESVFDDNSLKYLKNTNYSANNYQAFFSEFHVKRMEIDIPPQGLQLDEISSKVCLSAYLPFGFLTTGRMCMMKFLAQEGAEKYSLEKGCAKKCLNYVHIMKKIKNCQIDKNGNYEFNNLELYCKGNTVFYVAEDVEEVIENQSQVDRLIYQVGLQI